MSSTELHVILGTGAVGKATARALANMGKHVRMVNRSGKAAELPSGVEVVKGDVYNAANVAQLTKGATSVYQAAQPLYYEWAEKFPPLQAAVVEGVAASGGRLVVMENVYMYGDPNGRPMTENFPHAAHTKKGKIRAAMTEALTTAHNSGKLKVARGRASDFVGPEYYMGAEQLVYPAIEGKTSNVIGSPDEPHSFTYVPDVGRALATLGTHDEAFGEVWHIPSFAPLTQRQLVALVYKEAGNNLKIRAGGRLILSLMGLFNPNVREIVEMIYEFDKPFILDSSKFERTFGITATPIDQAIRETVAFFKAHPKPGANAA
ncbi:MAG: NAD-dependent epimerase/dehydratase family protein [Chloroflexi bacterium]|nr:NAD-dependent epimerase/dehydratase family protein [Chloroflexota bacterium]MCC6895253.1 NAD(P)H-binding protein [Anaerolineae bacterium]